MIYIQKEEVLLPCVWEALDTVLTEKMFDNVIDADGESVVVLGNVFTKSAVLKQLDYAAYKSAYAEWRISAMEDELDSLERFGKGKFCTVLSRK